MKNVLFVTYYFPPAGGPGVQRVTKHVKFLRQFGYEPTVLTVAPEDYTKRSELKMPLDESLGADVPEGVEIHRVPSRQPFGLLEKLASFRLEYLRDLCFVPDTAMTWVIPAVRQALRIARNKRIDLIYTSVKPHSAAFIGCALKKILNRPWVLDFRDPWTQYFLASFPTKLHYLMEQAMERFVLRRADHVVTITPSARNNLLRWCEFLAPERVHCITNGYDRDDFSFGEPNYQGESDTFKIVYSGVFCGAPMSNNSSGGNAIEKIWRKLRSRLAYTPRSFSRQTHSPKFLLDAMQELFTEKEELKNRLKFLHIGPKNEANEQYVRNLGFADSVEWIGYINHSEAIRYVMNADALFFCLADSPAGESNDCIPQKVFEYVGSRRPILALVPKGDAMELLQRSGTSIICGPRDINQIKNAILLLVEKKFRITPDNSYIDLLNRNNLTAKLANVFAQSLDSFNKISTK